jgi:ADP-glucose pyrophosphorylase
MKRSIGDIERADEAQLQAIERTKGMIGIDEDGRTLIDYQLMNAIEAGIADVAIVVGEHDTFLRDYMDERIAQGAFPELTICYAIQRIPAGREKPLGTADALECALLSRPDWSGGSFIVCNSDNLYSARALSLLDVLDHPCGLIEYDMEGLEYDRERISQFGITRCSHDGFLVDIIEKPTTAEIEEMRIEQGSVYVSMNIWRLDHDLVLPYLRDCPLHPVRQEKELPAAIRAMVRDHPRIMKALRLKEYVPDLTSIEDIGKMREYVRKTF